MTLLDRVAGPARTARPAPLPPAPTPPAPGGPGTPAAAAGVPLVRGLLLSPLAAVLWVAHQLVRRPSILVALTLVAACLPGVGGESTSVNVTPADLLALALVGAIGLRVAAGDRPLSHRAWVPFALVLIALAVATVASQDPAASLPGFIRYVELFVLVPVAVAAAVRDRWDVTLVGGTAVAVSLFEGAIGTVQALTGTGASFAGEDVRAVGTFGASDVMGMSQVVGFGIVIALALGLALRGRGRWVMLACAAALVVPMAYSLSRGSWIATAVAVVAVTVVAGRKLALKAGIALVALGVIVIGGLGIGSATLAERAGSIAAAPDQSVSDRYGLWAAAAGMWADHPVAGVGLKNFPAYRDVYAPLNVSSGSDVADATIGFQREPLLSPHNMYLLILSEQGLIGISAFGVLFAALLVAALRRRGSLIWARSLENRVLDLAAPGVVLWTLTTFLYGDIGGPSSVFMATLLGLVVRRGMGTFRSAVQVWPPTGAGRVPAPFRAARPLRVRPGAGPGSGPVLPTGPAAVTPIAGPVFAAPLPAHLWPVPAPWPVAEPWPVTDPWPVAGEDEPAAEAGPDPDPTPGPTVPSAGSAESVDDDEQGGLARLGFTGWPERAAVATLPPARELPGGVLPAPGPVAPIDADRPVATDAAGGSRLASAAAISAVLAAVGMALGLLRDLLLATYFGADGGTDAFLVAWTVPETAAPLLIEGAMAYLMVPLFSRALSRGESLRDVVRGTLPKLALVLVGLAALTFLGAPLLVAALAPGLADPGLAVSSTRIVAVTVLSFGLAGYLSAALRASRTFAAPAAIYLAYNVGIVVAIVALHERLGVRSAAIGVAAGGALMVAIQVPALVRALRTRAPRVRTVSAITLAAVAPVAVFTVVRQAQVLIERYLGSSLEAGTISHLNYAQKIGQVPMTLALVLTTVTFPALARTMAAGDDDGTRRRVRSDLATVSAVVLLASAYLFAYAPQVVGLLFEHGEYTAEDTAATAAILRVYLLGLLGHAFVGVLSRPFFSAETPTWYPAAAMGTGLLANAVLAAVLAGPFGAGGIAAANAAGISIAAVLLLVRVRLLVPGLTAGPVLLGAARLVVPAVAAATAGYALGRALAGPDLLVALVGGVLVLVVFGGVAALTDTPTVRAAAALVPRRTPR